MNGGRDGVRADEPVPAAAVGLAVAEGVCGVGSEAAAGVAGRSGGREAAGVPAAMLPAAARGRDGVADEDSGGRGVADEVSGGRAGAGADEPVAALVNAVLGAAEDSGGRGVADEVSGGRAGAGADEPVAAAAEVVLEAAAEDGGAGRAAGAGVLFAWGSGAYEYAARAAGTRDAPGAGVLAGAGAEADAGDDGLAAGVTHALSAGRLPPPGSSCSRM